ncbi:STAS domain-containing protein [bacterium BMS3Abin03]|nr:STAS domain-containing protein [bacterium BMS3Abin03]MCG6959002.1 STAS domain-containing protein [bacterium BMS3Abin03]
MDAFEKIYVDGVYVIAVNLTRSTIKDAYEFRKVIEEEINAGHTDIIIDLSKCDYVDSTFFGGIIWALGKMTDMGKKLKLVKPIHSKEDIFLTTNTISLFDLYNTREDAIKSFEGDNQPEN